MRRTFTPCCLWLAMCFAVVAVVHAEETIDQRLVVSIERIWDRAAHSAFTDLVEFNGSLYCTFREASDHIPGLNGTIRVIRSRDRMNWESVAILSEQHYDLRDPKLSITPKGLLMVNCGASRYHGSQRLGIESRVAFSDEVGEKFGPPQQVKLPEAIRTGFDWLWRVTWHGDVAWGAVQQVPSDDPRSLQLVRSRDGVTWEAVARLPVSDPSETTLRFDEDGTMWAMTRRSGNPSFGHIGRAEPPYTDWQYTPTDKSFGGPNFISLGKGKHLAGSRDNKRTALWGLNLADAKIQHLITLPSGGDNSYTGFAVNPQDRLVFVSYYSSHEGKAAIYLVTLRLDELLRAIE